MIRVGFKDRGKQKIVKEYLSKHKNINKVFVFYYKDFPIKFNLNVEVEYIEYSEIIMYRTFYPLLGKIDNDSLLIFNECMRTQNRSDLTYNCAHHYLNQTEHQIIFEYFPIIDKRDDFMILLDFESKGKYKGKSFDYMFLKDEDILIKPRKIKLDLINVYTTNKEKENYEKEKNKLFDNLGMKDPDTIPRNLQIFSGNLKKKAVEDNKVYIARNKRFKKDNVITYKEIEKRNDYIIIDTHYRRLNFNDFLKTTGITTVKYITTDLPIDNVIITEFTKWKARVEAIYAQANLC